MRGMASFDLRDLLFEIQLWEAYLFLLTRSFDLRDIFDIHIKDLTNINELKEFFQNTKILFCLFHVIKWLKGVISKLNFLNIQQADMKNKINAMVWALFYLAFILYLGTSREKILEDFWFFLEMWKWISRKFILECYFTIPRRPRLEIVSSRFRFLEVFFCSSRTQNLEILIRDFPRVFFPRDTTLREWIPRGFLLCKIWPKLLFHLLF